MTDRYNAFIVILEWDIRSDDAKMTINAIKHIKGVLGVEPHVATIDESIAKMRLKEELWEKVFQLFKEFGE